MSPYSVPVYVYTWEVYKGFVVKILKLRTIYLLIYIYLTSNLKNAPFKTKKFQKKKRERGI
ncbi:hypothetical protein RhiirC2_516700 [Rhizophagus irregularis]|uniref:Uncharacterized protein n=1 Tax=Rhizophagus irregularis TaxID=588596 RepID=A0A2N1NXH2_9GLOM|nr:hypothetical protein RhiirC2_516700 [Rhizophagus irregularis]